MLCPSCIANRENTELFQGKQDPSQAYLGFLEAQLCSEVAEAPVPGALCLSLCKTPEILYPLSLWASHFSSAVDIYFFGLH